MTSKNEPEDGNKGRVLAAALFRILFGVGIGFLLLAIALFGASFFQPKPQADNVKQSYRGKSLTCLILAAGSIFFSLACRDAIKNPDSPLNKKKF